jgi:hypothetical protein
LQRAKLRVRWLRPWNINKPRVNQRPTIFPNSDSTRLFSSDGESVAATEEQHIEVRPFDTSGAVALSFCE